MVKINQKTRKNMALFLISQLESFIGEFNLNLKHTFYGKHFDTHETLLLR